MTFLELELEKVKMLLIEFPYNIPLGIILLLIYHLVRGDNGTYNKIHY